MLRARWEEEASPSIQPERAGAGGDPQRGEPRDYQAPSSVELAALTALARLEEGEPLAAADWAALQRLGDDLLGPEDDDPARSCPPDDHACTCPPDDHGRGSRPDDDDARPGRAGRAVSAAP